MSSFPSAATSNRTWRFAEFGCRSVGLRLLFRFPSHGFLHRKSIRACTNLCILNGIDTKTNTKENTCS